MKTPPHLDERIPVGLVLDASIVREIDRIAFERQQTNTRRISRSCVIRDILADFVSSRTSRLPAVSATEPRHRSRAAI